MTQRRRMSRAQVERTPGMRGTRADLLIIDDPWTPTTPPVDRAAVDAWWGDVAAWPRVERRGVLPSDPPADVMTMETLDAMVRLLKDAPGPPPGAVLMSQQLAREMERFGTVGRSDDYTDAIALALQSLAGQREDERAAARERRAVERAGRALVAWLIGRWRP